MRSSVLASFIALVFSASALALPAPVTPAWDNAGLVESKRDDVPVQVSGLDLVTMSSTHYQGEAIGALVAAGDHLCALSACALADTNQLLLVCQ